MIKPEDLLISPNARKKNIFERINKIYEKTILNLKGISININAVAKVFQRANYGPYFGDRKIFIKYHKANSLVDLMNKKKLPKLFSYFFSYLIIFYLRVFDSIKKKQIKKNITFINLKKSPKWSNSLNKKFINYWNFFTTDRTKDFFTMESI